MPRIAGEIQEGDIRPTARPGDFYNRPAVGPESRLEQIAAAYDKIGVHIGGYLRDRKKKQEDLEIAQGVELFKMRQALGENFTAAEMAEKAEKGDYEGFKRLTRFQKEGIRRARHEAAGLKLQEHMQTWQSTATLPDENGNPVPLDQITDSDRVIDAFNRESARWLMEKTGGQYDPVLAQEYIRDSERSAMNQFIQQQAAKRNEQIRTEQRLAAAELMDAYTAPIINDGLFDADPYTAGRRFYDNISHVAETLMRDGVSQSDASEFLGQYMQSALRSVNSHDLIDKMLAIAQVHPFLQDPTLKEQIIAAAEYGHRSVEWAKDRENEQKEELARQQSFDILNGIRTGTLSPEQLDAFRYASPENMAWAQKMQEAFIKAADSSHAMDAEDFHGFRTGVLHGDVPWSSFMARLEDFSAEQQDEIWSCYTKREERTRRLISLAEAQGKRLTRAAIVKKEKSDRSEVEKALNVFIKPRLDRLQDTGFVNEYANLDETSVFMEDAIFDRWMKWQDNNPALAADTTENKLALKSITKEVYDLYSPNFDEYERNSSLARRGPYALRVETALNSITALKNTLSGDTERQQAMMAALRSGDVGQTAELLCRYGTADKNTAKGKAAQYVTHQKFLDEEIAKTQKQGGETNAGGTASTN